MHLEVLLSAGILPIMTVGEPGAQEPTVTGMHGIGVNTPSAAVVALATVGLASDVHIPKGSILAIGLLSKILQYGSEVATLLAGRERRVLGTFPKLHWSVAPPQTSCPIVITLFICLFITKADGNRMFWEENHSTLILLFTKINGNK